MIPVKPRVPRNGGGPVKDDIKIKGVKVHVGKGGGSQMLPSRNALNTLTKGDPIHRSIGWYGKLSPIGAGAPGRYADIQAMGERGIDLEKDD